MALGGWAAGRARLALAGWAGAAPAGEPAGADGQSDRDHRLDREHDQEAVAHAHAVPGQGDEQAAQGGDAQGQRDLLGGGQHAAARAGRGRRDVGQDHAEQRAHDQALPGAGHHHAGHQPGQ